MSNELKRNAVGTAGIVFFVVAAAAPLAATLGASPLVFGATGVGGPGAYLAATLVLLLFAVGYATMSRYVTSAGGFAAYISRGLGRPWGLAAAFVALLAYNAMLAGIFGQLGAFAHDILRDRHGLIVRAHETVLSLSPPLVIADDEVDRVVAALQDTLTRIGEGVG